MSAAHQHHDRQDDDQHGGQHGFDGAHHGRERGPGMNGHGNTNSADNGADSNADGNAGNGFDGRDEAGAVFGPVPSPRGGGEFDALTGAGAVPLWGTPDTGTDTGTDATTDTAPGGMSGQDEDGEGSASGAGSDGPSGPSGGPGGSAGGVSGSLAVLPSWATSWDAFSGLVAERVTRAARLSAYHALRAPWYWLRTLVPALRTLARVVRAVFDWTRDAKGSAVRSGLAYGPSLGGMEGTAYHRVTEQHRETKRIRLAVTGTVTVVLSAVVAALSGHVSVLGWTTAGVIVPVVLSWFSRNPAKPIVAPVRYGAVGVPPLDTALIASALDALGIAQLSKGLKAEGVHLSGPIHRDGPGWRADVDLPAGVPAGDVTERRDRLAAGLRRPLSCVWPTSDPDAHEARLILWVGDKALNQSKPRPWPLAKVGTVNLFGRFTIGTDQRGKPVTLSLMFAAMLIGAIPRMGKTFALRVILLAAALDVLAELHVYDLKGGADLRPLGSVAHRFRIGDDDEDIAYLAADVADVKAEMSRRYKVLRGLPESICPEGKVTPELAARKDLRLHPVVIAIDECQIGFEHTEYGKAIEADITDLVKRGPAVGIMVILATQRPDAKSIPAAISGNAALRFCLKVTSHVANDMVLGTGAYKAGTRATMFALSDKGTGLLVGEGDEPTIVTFSYIDGPAAKTIAARARAARELAGTITGYAADLDAQTPEPAATLLDDLAHVITPDEPKVWSEVLVERLAAYRPETYTGWTPGDLGNAASAYGVTPVQIGRREAGKFVNRRGIDRATVTAAITERDLKRSA